ncbi:MAG TPA: nucleotidyltransferase family protein [Gaiellaceae bacterium]|nr:nucleotidyltransferase family protein [Gaiellaceae bacterium]
MKALILAAGYATRLRPLTDSIPKQLLPIGGRPMVDWILDKLRETDCDEVHLVTNARFADGFRRWAADKDVLVHDDGTKSNEDRLGAIGDIRFVDLDDDLLAIAGDNLFDFSLRDYVAFWRAKDGASCVAVHDVGDRELAKKYGIVDLDEDGRLVGFVEKPADPPTTLAATATYLFARDHVRLVPTYLDEGNPPDQPGNFVGWLQAREPVFAYRFEGDWWDIGDRDQLLAADNLMRRRSGLPERAEYSAQS